MDYSKIRSSELHKNTKNLRIESTEILLNNLKDRLLSFIDSIFKLADDRATQKEESKHDFMR